MSPRPLLVLPPSAGKSPGGDGPPWRETTHRFADLDPARRALRTAIGRHLRAGGDAAALFGVSDRALPAARADWGALDRAATLPALARYTGVVWEALSPATLSTPARRALRTRVVIISGLWGCVGASDPIPAYRLPIGARVPGVGGLAAYWRPTVSDAIRIAAGRGWIFDLLPDDHALALRDDLPRRCRVQIVAGGSDGRRALGHAGKAVKGRLARAILEQDPRTPAELAAIQVDELSVVERSDQRVTFQLR